MSADARDIPDLLRREFARWQDAALTARYASAFGPLTDQVVPALGAMCDPHPEDDALDLCCGPGALAVMLRAAGARTVALDFSLPMLELARERAPGAAAVQGRAEHLPLADHSFDLVVSNHGLAYAADLPRAFAEARRVLRTGGRFAFSAWLGPDQSPAMRIFLDALREAGGAAATPWPDLLFLADARQVRSMLEESGFTAFRQEKIPSAWMLESPEHLFDAFADASVRPALLIARLPAAKRDAIRAAMVRDVLALLGPAGPWQVAMPAVVIGATAA